MSTDGQIQDEQNGNSILWQSRRLILNHVETYVNIYGDATIQMMLGQGRFSLCMYPTAQDMRELAEIIMKSAECAEEIALALAKKQTETT